MRNVSIRGEKKGKKARHKKVSSPQDDLNIHPKSKFVFFKTSNYSGYNHTGLVSG